MAATLIAIAIGYVVVLLLAPLAGILWPRSWAPASGTMLRARCRDPDVECHAFVLTAILTLLTVTVTGFFGVITALVLTRDRFWGRRLLSGIVDLPLAVSPVIVG